MDRNGLDRWIFFTVLGLMAFGIIMVYSASAIYADKVFHDNFYYLKRQGLWVFLGIVAMLAAYRFPYQILQRRSWVFIALSIALLLYLLVSRSGRWIPVGSFHIQVSDLARLSLILFFADSLSRKEQYLKSLKDGFIPHVFYIAVIAGLVLFQPDFSSAAMIVFVGLAMLFVSPTPFRYFGYSFLVLLPIATLVVKLSRYKLDRWEAFLDPHKDVLGKGYQIIQSLISLGAGGITGVGFAQSSQKLFFLPEAHTDFIFSIIGEEWGLIGTVVILSLFFVLLVRGTTISQRATDKFSQYLAFGLTVNLVFYALINMMVAVHLAPPTGLPLPFISYGGSSMIVSGISAGLLLNISRQVHSRVQRSNVRFASRAQRNWENRKLRYVK